jgi:hypothetical protein
LTRIAFCCRRLPGLSGASRLPVAERNPMTFVAIIEKHTEENYEKKEKKLDFNGNREMMGAFDGIDSDLRLDMILNGRL